MKTLEELYNELAASDALKKEFLALKTPEEVAAFAKKHGCDATFEDIKAFFSEEPDKEGELSEDELENVAGGKSADLFEGVLSTFTVGLFCAAAVISSAIFGKVGTGVSGEGMLCYDNDNIYGDSLYSMRRNFYDPLYNTKK